MKRKSLMAVLALSALSFNAMANWQVANGFCQTYSDDGRAMLRIKPTVVGIVNQERGCDVNIDYIGSNFGLNGQTLPSVDLCNSNSKQHFVTSTTDKQAIATVISQVASSDKSTILMNGQRYDFTRGDYAQVCSQVLPIHAAVADSQDKHLTLSDNDIAVATAAAKDAYKANYDEATLETADFGSYRQLPPSQDPTDGTKLLRVVEFEVYNPALRIYDNIRVTLNASGQVTGTQVQFMGK